MSIYGGVFNFDSIMNDFYSDQGKSNEQKIMKSAYQGNMIQSGFNSQLAMQMAQQQSAISKDQMKFAAELERQNAAFNYEQQFKYGSAMMGQQFELQNEFSDNQHKRDLGMTAAKGDDNRKTVSAVGVQDRLNRITQGEQDRLSTVNTGEQQRLTDTNKLAVQGAEQRETDTNKIQTQGVEERLNIQTTGDEQRQTDTNRIETTGREQRATDTNRITTEGTEQRATDTNRIRTTGDETRITMDKEDEILARKNDRQNARARSIARAF